jgi:hypothetical protein
MNLQEVIRLRGEKGVLSYFEKQYPDSYDAFLRTVYECLDKAIAEAQRAAQYLFAASEDCITTFIVSNLRSQELDADHDSDSGGHVDILVADADKRFSWAAEAKIDTDWGWIEGGIGQLMDRYADGTVGRDQGGFLLYIKNEGGATRLADWRQRVIAKYSSKQGFRVLDCPNRHPYAFFSECVFPKTGQLFRIRHVGVLLFREASKAAADAKAAEVKSSEAQMAEAAKATAEAASASAKAAEAIGALLAARPADAELSAAVAAAKFAAKKSEHAAQVAKRPPARKAPSRQKGRAKS